MSIFIAVGSALAVFSSSFFAIVSLKVSRADRYLKSLLHVLGVTETSLKRLYNKVMLSQLYMVFVMIPSLVLYSLF